MISLRQFMKISVGTVNVEHLAAKVFSLNMLRFLVMILLITPPALAYDDIAGPEFLKCYDGDTCTFIIPEQHDVFQKMEVRFRGIDAPEMHGKCEKEKAMAFAAKALVVSYLKQARFIELKKVNRDKYFRLNAHVVADGINLSDELKRLGYAVEYWGNGQKHDWCKP